MKALSLCLSLCLAVAPSGAMETHRGNIITLTDADMDECEAGGGCVFVTKEKLLAAIASAAKQRAGNCMGSVNFRP